MPNKTWMGAFVGFVIIAGLVAVALPSLLPKVSAETLTIQNCQFSPDTFELDKNQTIKLSVKSDLGGTFAIDDYNLSKTIVADQPEDINFKTVRSGAIDATFSDCEEHATLLVRDDDGNLPSLEEHHDEAESHHHDETGEIETDDHVHDEN